MPNRMSFHTSIASGFAAGHFGFSAAMPLGENIPAISSAAVMNRPRIILVVFIRDSPFGLLPKVARAILK